MAVVTTAVVTTGDVDSRQGPGLAGAGDVPAGGGVLLARAGVVARAPDPREARLQRLLGAWWQDERPEWTSASWWDAPLRDRVRALMWLPAGPALSSALSELGPPGTCPDPHDGEGAPGFPAPGSVPGWPCACQVVMAAAWEACAAWVAVGVAEALVAAAGREEVVFPVGSVVRSIREPAREELALALRTSVGSMATRMSRARELVAHPGLLELVRSGGVSPWAAHLVLLEISGVPDPLARQVLDVVVERVRSRLASGGRAWTPAEVARVARAVRLRAAPESDLAARQRARGDRRVQVEPGRDGMSWLTALLDSTDAHRIHRRLTALAGGLDDEQRTRDQVRADVLVDLLLGPAPVAPSRPGEPTAGRVPPTRSGSISSDEGAEELATGSGAVASVGRTSAPPAWSAARSPGVGTSAPPAPPARSPAWSGARVEVNVIVPLATLLGARDAPGEIPGLGPVPAEVARTLAADGVWRAWMTDASGAVVATGSRGYVPSADVARLVRAREPYCRMPGCRRAAERCDLDHTVPWPAGDTHVDNLGPLCRRHHLLKTHAGWALVPTRGLPTPGWRWRTPAGFEVRDWAAATVPG